MLEASSTNTFCWGRNQKREQLTIHKSQSYRPATGTNVDGVEEYFLDELSGEIKKTQLHF